MSRRLLLVLSLLTLGIVSAIAVLAALWSEDDPPPGGSEEARIPAPPADAIPMHLRWVYDGDTVKLQNVGPNDLVTTPAEIDVRIIGIDTPEVHPKQECFGNQATEFLRSLIPVNSTVLVAPDQDTWDDFQRRLFNLWTSDGRFVAYEMVAGGYGEALRIWPNVTYSEFLDTAETVARNAAVGQWGAC